MTETEVAGANHDHHGYGCHHSQTVATTMGRGGLWPPGSGASQTLRFVQLFGPSSFALDHSSWAYCASFATFLDLAWLKVHAFLLIFGSIYVHLQSKT